MHTFLRQFLEEYRQGGKIRSIMDTQETDVETENDSPELETPEETIPKVIIPEVFDPCYGSPPGDEEDSLEKVKREFKPSAQKLLEAFDLSDLDEFERRIRENFKPLCRIPQRLSAIRNTGIRMDSDQEVVLQ